MNKTRIVVLAAVAAVFTAGCATTAPPAATGSTPRYEVNGEYVAAVERKARRQGVEVIWLHKPTRPAG